MLLLCLFNARADNFVSSSPHMACERTSTLPTPSGGTPTSHDGGSSALSALTLRRGAIVWCTPVTGKAAANVAPHHVPSTRVSGMFIG